jgi:hypothetical protein
MLGPIQRLPLGGTNTEDPEAAINGRGEAVFTRLRLFEGSDPLVQARRRSAAGALPAATVRLPPARAGLVLSCFSCMAGRWYERACREATPKPSVINVHGWISLPGQKAGPPGGRAARGLPISV